MDEKQYISVPPGVGFSLESTANSGARALLDTILMYRSQILQVFLAEFIMQGILGTGSFAAQSDKTEMLLMAINGFLDKIEAVWNRFGVARLFEFNPWYTGELPQVTHTKVRKPNLDELGEFIQRIAAFVPLQNEDILWIREQAGMPEVEIDSEPPEDEEPEMAEFQEGTGHEVEREAPTDELTETLEEFLDDQRRRVTDAGQALESDPDPADEAVCPICNPLNGKAVGVARGTLNG